VRATGTLVHVGLAHGSFFVAHAEKAQEVVLAGYDALLAVHVHDPIAGLVDLQVLILLVQQVIDLLVINLYVAHAQQKVALLLTGDLLEDLLGGQHHDARVLAVAHHRVGLPCET